jgi:3-oxoacyl-[acyl-carrier-protein] synthase II
VSSAITITGIGLITPLGSSAAQTWDSLFSGDSIRDHAKISLPDAPSVSRIVTLARHAATEAIREAGWDADCLESPCTALIVATSKGPVEEWLDGKLDLDGIAGVATGVAAGLGMGSGPRLTVSAACSSGLHAMIRAVMMLRSGEVDRALVVGAEASVHPLFVGSFRRLGVLAPEGYGCRPFDSERKGFLMSDAAAAICLERGDIPGIARIERFAMGADATHITGSDPSGGVLRRLLREVIDGRPIDLVHGHATGTVANDVMELNAIDSSLDESRNRPAVYSHKGALGHSLGASGMVALALNCLMHRHEMVPPNANLKHPLPARHVELHSIATRRSISRSVALAAGFGGPIGVVSMVSG